MLLEPSEKIKDEIQREFYKRSQTDFLAKERKSFISYDTFKILYAFYNKKNIF